MRSRLVVVVTTLVLVVAVILPAGVLADTTADIVTLTGKLKPVEFDGQTYWVLDGQVLITEGASLDKLGYYFLKVSGTPVDGPSGVDLPAIKVKDFEVIDKGEGRLILEGAVTHRDIETGFFEVSGYRLKGVENVEDWQGKTVRVMGLPDMQPSIFMTMAIDVYSIEEIPSEPGQVVMVEGTPTLRVHSDGYGTHWVVDGYAVTGPYSFANYNEARVKVAGTVSPGPAIDGDPVLVVSDISVVEPSTRPGDAGETTVAVPAVEQPFMPISVWLEGKQVTLTRPPVLVNSHTLVNVNDLLTMGVEFERSDQTLEIILANDPLRTLKLVINSNLLAVSQQPVEKMDTFTVQREVDSEVLVPLRPVLEALGFTVRWNQETYSVDVSR